MESSIIPATREWDVVIVGTGVGGATVGWDLASRGLSVLFLEKGTRITGSGEEQELTSPEARLARGWWPQPVSRQRGNGSCERFFAPLGCAFGGSSIYYAAALERMAASDFEALRTAEQPVPAWPVKFAEFERCYAAAETLYGLAPCSSDAVERRLSEWDRALMDTMRRNGLQPQHLQVAMRYDQECAECIGRLCPRACKADSRMACLEPALRAPQCAALDHCEVHSLEADATRVHTLRARHKERALEIRAKVFVLAAGALHSPQILLRSGNRYWPNGLANRSDQVGRNLMFHTADIYAVWSPVRRNRHGRQKKSISVRDFYQYQGQRMGYVQSLGVDAGRGAVAVYLKDLLRRHGLRNEFLLRALVKLPSHIAARFLGDAGLFAAMTEDDPHPGNRVVLDPDEPDGAKFIYTITDELRSRADGLRELFARHIRPWKLVRLSPELTMNYGHPCGTCRFGDDPAASVLDRYCRAHELENLYVLDASFMPRSGAVNPSLTIAANSLRVAPVIAGRLGAPAVPQRRGDGRGAEPARGTP
jgi:choline dehydrogenase-like flavoprotein